MSCEVEVAPEISQVVVARRTPTVVVQTPGPQGVRGLSGTIPFEHVQASASATWIINHNLGRNVLVYVMDAGGNGIICEALNVTLNQARVYINTAITGRALCF